MDINNSPIIIGDDSQRNMILDYCKKNRRLTVEATTEEIRNRAHALGINIPKTSK
jgi:hypothetical protein